MNRWRLIFTLKSGSIIEGLHKGSETNSDDIANKYLAGEPNTFNSMYDSTEKHAIFVNNAEVAALDISVW